MRINVALAGVWTINDRAPAMFLTVKIRGTASEDVRTKALEAVPRSAVCERCLCDSNVEKGAITSL